MTSVSWRAVLAVWVIGGMVATSAWGQEKGPAKGAGLPSRAVLQRAQCALREAEVDAYGSLYADYRSWQQLQQALAAKIAACTGAKASTESPYLVTVIRPSDSFTVIVPQAKRYSPHLPGVVSVQLLLLVAHHDPAEDTMRDFRLVSTETASELVTNLPEFVQQVAGAVIGGVFPAAVAQSRILSEGSDAPPVAPPPPPYETAAFFTKEAVPLPFRNGGVEESGRVSVWKDADGKAEDVQISASFLNKTKVRTEFTTVVGALVGGLAGDERMKVTDAGKYASDPLPRGMTLAALAFHPKPFDATEHGMSGAERVALLLGGVITPAPGIGAGVSVGIIRGFAINLGGVLVSVATSKNGAKPKDEAPEGNNQLRYGWNRGFFLGGGYVFKGK